MDEQAALVQAGATPEALGAVWQRLDELGQRAGAAFPLSDAEAAELRAGLQRRVRALYEGEVATVQRLGTILDRLGGEGLP